MTMFRKLGCWRHGLGFGVHSPLAFELIYSVLRDKPEFYADAKIKAICPTRRKQRLGRIILRLIARFEPNAIYADADYTEVVSLATKKATLTHSTDDADMTIVATQNSLAITIGKEKENTGPLVLDNLKDLKITIYQKGLSPTLIHTTL